MSMKEQLHDLFSSGHVVIDKNVVAALSAEEIASSLKRNQSIESLHLKETLFACEGYQSPTLRRLRCLLECIPQMSQLREVTLSGQMSIDNPHDVQILSNVIQRHPTLRRIKLHNFVVYAPELPDSAPLLDTFLVSCSTLPHLETLHVHCHASYKTWEQCYVSVGAMGPICRSPLLQKLTLSKLRLQDEHFNCIGQMLNQTEGPILSQLILSGNENSDVGTQCIMTELMHSRFRCLERLEIVSRFRASESTSYMLLKLLNTNHSLKHCKINLKHQYRAKFEFYLLLNRSGRKVMMNPDTIPGVAVDVLVAASNNLSVLMQLLLDKPEICRLHQDSGDNSLVGPLSEAPLTPKTICSKEPSSLITHNLCDTYVENHVGTISVAPAVTGVVRNLATDLWRIIWPKRRR